MTVGELATQLVKDVQDMKRHIFTAATTWAHLKQNIDQLRPGTIITYEDYQRNFELTHMEMPTSMGYAANNIQLGMFPMGGKFRRPLPQSTPSDGAFLHLFSAIKKLSIE